MDNIYTIIQKGELKDNLYRFEELLFKYNKNQNTVLDAKLKHFINLINHYNNNFKDEKIKVSDIKQVYNLEKFYQLKSSYNVILETNKDLIEILNNQELIIKKTEKPEKIKLIHPDLAKSGLVSGNSIILANTHILKTTTPIQKDNMFEISIELKGYHSLSLTFYTEQAARHACDQIIGHILQE